MRTETFVAAVRTAAGIDTQQHASLAVMATVEVLAHRFADAVHDLAALLPVEMQDRMTTEPTAGLPTGLTTDRFPIAAFYARVGAIEGNGCADVEVRRHVRATMHELRATLEVEFTSMFDRFPPGYADLVEALPTLATGVARVVPATRLPHIPQQRLPLPHH